MSHNHILDVSDLGLENCEMPEFKKLDLSHNHLTTWRSGSTLSFANTLEALYLNNNRLGILADNAFAQMTNLKELNLADNQLAALPPTLFTTQMNSLESLQVSSGTVNKQKIDFLADEN